MNGRTWVLIGLGVVLIALAAVGQVSQAAYGNIGYVLNLLLTGAVAYAATLCARDAPQASALVIILAVALIVRLVVMSTWPLMSTDIYRYIWDGRVQAAGINPYLYVPADPALAALRDPEIHARINRADYAHTAYPPFAQIFFLIATRLGDSVLAMRAAFVLCEVGIVLAIGTLLTWMGKPRTLIVAYAWHPMAIWETANGGHVDALVSLLVVGSLVVLTAGRRLTGAALVAFSVLVKPYAVVLLPIFWRPWDVRAPLVVVAVVAALYVPYLGAGTAVIGFIPGYLREEGIESGSALWLVALARRALGDVPGLQIAYVLLGIAVFAMTIVLILRRRERGSPERHCRNAAILLAIGLFFLSPNYPWYFLPLVPFIALVGGATLWAMTLGAMLLHAPWPGVDDGTRFLLLKSVLNLSWMLALVATWRGRVAIHRAGEGVSP